MNRIALNEKIAFGADCPLGLLAGPCVIESRERTMKIAKGIKEITGRLNMPFVFKSSFDKANRSSVHSYRGPDFHEALDILRQIKEELDVPIITDVHSAEQVEAVSKVADILQIPAFLCRQTDLLIAAGETGKIVNVKKGQFLAPWDMKHVIAKIESTGNRNILVTERGFSFGYNNLVVDMRSLIIMRQFGYPVVFDATHSVQLPGGNGESSGGNREYVPYLTRAAVGTGVDVLFMEVHDQPEEALSDGPNMVRLHELEAILEQALAIDQIVRKEG